MRVLCIGGLGFVGSHLAEALQAIGHSVSIVDDLSHNAVDDLKVDHIYRMSLVNLAAQFVKGHLVHAESISEFQMSPLGYDIIFHLASPIGPALIKEDVTYEIIRGTRTALGLADLSTKFVYFSTSEVKVGLPIEYDIRSSYRIGKLAAECMVWNDPLKYPPQIVRPANIFGPRQRPDGGQVVARFVDLTRHHKPLTVFGDGSQRRSFTHVADVVKFCLMLCKSWPTERNVWDVTDPRWNMSILELAGLVAVMAGGTTRILTNADPIETLGNPYWNDVKRGDSCPTSTSASRYGWVPEGDLISTIAEMLNA